MSDALYDLIIITGPDAYYLICGTDFFFLRENCKKQKMNFVEANTSYLFVTRIIRLNHLTKLIYFILLHEGYFS